MILVIPTVFISKGKSTYSVSGIEGLDRYEDYLKQNPLELIKILREENNKTLLIDSDNSEESQKLINSIVELLDIPIQIKFNKDSTIKFIDTISKLNIFRVFCDIELVDSISPKFFDTIPIIKLNEYNKDNCIEYSRVMIDAEGIALSEIEIEGNCKVSIINTKSNTKSLTKLHTSQSSIDSIYLGKEYYGVNYVGQILWRKAELEQLSR